MSIAERILDEIIKQNMVNVAAPDPEVTHVLVWNANVCEQLEATVKEAVLSCQHPADRHVTAGSSNLWCSRCGSLRRVVSGEPFGEWQQPDVV